MKRTYLSLLVLLSLLSGVIFHSPATAAEFENETSAFEESIPCDSLPDSGEDVPTDCTLHCSHHVSDVCDGFLAAGLLPQSRLPDGFAPLAPASAHFAPELPPPILA